MRTRVNSAAIPDRGDQFMKSYHFSCPLLVALLLCVFIGSASGTDHSGTIEDFDHWSAFDNPHIINGTVTVAEGGHLLIGPGVVVQSRQGCYLRIEGQLTVDGDPGNEVLFTQQPGYNRPTTAIHFLSSGWGYAQDCVVELANTGINLSTTAGQVRLLRTMVRDCGTGIDQRGGGLQLESVTIRENSVGVRCRDVAPQFLDSAVVVTDNSIGIQFIDVPNLALTTPLTVSNSTSRGIYLTNCSLPTIDNVTLTGNASYGALYFENCGDFMLGTGNVIGGAGQENAWPVTIKLGSYPAAGCVIPASGNENNDVRVDGGISSVNGTWRDLPGVDFVLPGTSVTVLEGGTLTIEPGVTIHCRLGSSAPTITVQGTLNAIGTANAKILFVSDESSRLGFLKFEEGGSGTLEHWLFDRASTCVITESNATGTVTIIDTEMRDCSTGLYVRGGGVTVRMGSTEISPSSYGIRCEDVIPVFLDGEITIAGGSSGMYLSDIPNMELTTPLEITGASQAGVRLVRCLDPLIDNLTVTGCGGTSYYGAFYLDRCGTFTLGTGNVIGGEGQENTWPVTIRAGAYPSAECVIPTTGNTNNDIRVSGGTSDGNSGRWSKFTGLEYVVTDTPTLSAGDTLTIAPGVRARFYTGYSSDEGATIQGTLIAQGTPDQKIEFLSNTTETWDGIVFEGTGSGDLSNCVFDHAGTAINLQGTGTVTITDCVLRDGGNGVYGSGGIVRIGSTDILEMSTYGMSFQTTPPVLLDENVVIENCNYGMRLYSIDDLNFSGAVLVSGAGTIGVWVDRCPDPFFDNLTVTGCTGNYGAFHFDRCGEITLGAGNVIGGEGQENSWPITISMGSYPTADCIIPTTGNTNNDIRVYNGTSTRSGIWRKFANLDYVVDGLSQIIGAGTSLTIEPGVNVRFENYSADLEVQGELFADGLPGQEIVFTSHGENSWDGLKCTDAGSIALAHCLIEQASDGILLEDTGTVHLMNTVVRDCEFGIQASDGTVQLGSTTISDCDYGMRCDRTAPTFLDEDVILENCGTGVDVRYVDGLIFDSPLTVRGCTDAGVSLYECDTPTIDNLVLTGNLADEGAIYVRGCGDFLLGAGNVIGGPGQENSWPLAISRGAYPAADCVIPVTGNVNIGILITGSGGDQSGTWRLFPGLDYHLQWMIIGANTTVTIEPGVSVRGRASNSQLYVYGTLNAIGTPEQPIRFTGQDGAEWGGLVFYHDGSAEFVDCRIEDANWAIRQAGNGPVSLTHCTVTNGNTGIFANAGTVTLTDCTVSNGSHGVNITNGTVTLQRTRITGNSEYGIYLDGGGTAVFGASADEWNDILDNGADRAGRALRNGAADIAAPYVWWGTTDPEEIAAAIIDGNDNASFGIVDFTPYLNADHEVEGVSAVDPGDPVVALPEKFALAQAAPNPFNPMTLIRFDTTKPSQVRLTILDIAGRVVATLVNEQMAAGKYERTWRGCDDRGRAMPSGVYFSRIESDEGVMTRKLTLVR